MASLSFGELRITGVQDNVISFLKNAIEDYKGGCECDGEFIFKYSEEWRARHLKGTEGCFVNVNTINAYHPWLEVSSEEEHKRTLAANISIECCGDLDCSGLMEASKHYKINIRGAVGNDKFFHEVNIRNGEVELDNLHEYKDEDGGED